MNSAASSGNVPVFYGADIPGSLIRLTTYGYNWPPLRGNKCNQS